ncbi:MAG: LprI family protein, partial [Fibromonadales bacterium]|nr:LprI family protein [Fibromonadales bacterium]
MKKQLTKLALTAALGLALAFTLSCDKESKTPQPNAMPDKSYIGMWYDSDDPAPNELEIFEIDSTIKFELGIYRLGTVTGTAKFENNKIVFVNEYGDSGTLKFNEGSILITVEKSDNQYIQGQTYNFVIKAGAEKTASEPQAAKAVAAKEDKKHPIDIQYDKCMGEDAAPTTQSMTDCSAEAEKDWDSEHNKNYKALMAKLGKPEQEKLKLAQRKWIEYRDLAFDFTADYYERNGGTMQRISISINRMDFFRERALALKAYLDADKCDCGEKTEKDWDSELNKNYKTLMAELDKPEQEKLKLAQRKWIEYRDLEF